MKKKILISSFLFRATGMSNSADPSSRIIPIEPLQYMLKCPVLNQLEIKGLCHQNQVTKENITLEASQSCKSLAFGKLLDHARNVLLQRKKEYDGNYDHTDHTCGYTIHPLLAGHEERYIKFNVISPSIGEITAHPNQYHNILNPSSNGAQTIKENISTETLSSTPPLWVRASPNKTPPSLPGIPVSEDTEDQIQIFDLRGAK